MKKRQIRLVCALAALIMTVGVCPVAVAGWADYASPKIDATWFQVDAGSDTYVEVDFGVDSACDLICQVEVEPGTVLGTYNVKNGTVITLSGGGTFYLFVWSEKGSCNWEATLADSDSVPNVLKGGGTTGGGSVTDLEGESSVGSADCNGKVLGSRTTLNTPGYAIIKCYITKDCYPAMACFTVPAGRVATLTDPGIKSGGYNCATGAYINDPGLTVEESCCPLFAWPLYTCGINKDGQIWTSGVNSFGPGTYTVYGNGGRNFAAEVKFLVK